MTSPEAQVTLTPYPPLARLTSLKLSMPEMVVAVRMLARLVTISTVCGSRATRATVGEVIDGAMDVQGRARLDGAVSAQG